MRWLPGYNHRPEPNYKNVVPAGAGWYRFVRGKWMRIPSSEIKENNYLPPGAKWIDNQELMQMALRAIKELRR